MKPTMKLTWADDEQLFIRDDTEAIPRFIPADPSNRDYKEILEGGHEIDPYVEPIVEELSVIDKFKSIGLTETDILEFASYLNSDKSQEL